MWNDKENHSVLFGDGDLELNSEPGVADKVEKHLDLSNYLSFLQNFFNKSTSDSEDSDTEAINEDGVQRAALLLGPQSSSNLDNIQHQDKFLPSVAAEGINFSDGDMYGLQQQRNDNKGPFEVTSPSSSSSNSSSSFSRDEEDSCFLPAGLTPMSDLELNNLQTNYLGPDADPISFEIEDTSTTDSDNKKNSKKKKKKSKKKNDDGSDHRHNKPNSDGKGNGSGYSGYRGDSSGHGMNNNGGSNSTGSSHDKSGGGSSSSRLSNSHMRKQSLKFLRAEANNRSNSSSGGEIGLISMPTSSLHNSNAAAVGEGKGTFGIGATLISAHPGKSNGKNVLNKKWNNSPLSQALHNNAVLHCASSSSIISGLPSTPEHLVRDDDDNNSLSDYISMAATVAATTTAQVPPLPQPQGDTGDDDEEDEEEDSFFGFDEAVLNSIYFKASSPGVPSFSKMKNSHPPSAGKSSMSTAKKRKLESDDGDQVDEPKAKKSSLHRHNKMIEMFNMKRKKVYVYICKKKIPKSQRGVVNFHKEAITAKRKLAQACSRFVRQKAIQSQKTMKESVWRAKRLTREMQAFWKQADRVERENKKRREKEAEEQRKLKEEIMEAKRKQRNLNFIITQTELYSYLMSRRLSKSPVSEEEESRILSQLKEAEEESLSGVEGYDDEGLKNLAKINVEKAFKSVDFQSRRESLEYSHMNGSRREMDEFLQPNLFEGDLKEYQMTGMNWLINLYNQGINGILGDEMGLGRKVQALAFLAHLAERYGIWGPFLIVAPTAGLNEWQELSRLVRNFKVIPYWGTPQERKALRQLLQLENLHTKEASFHIVVTSYPVVSTDFKYLHKLSWQYMILDEPQTMKTAASARWKTLLGFNCPQRLLMSSAPVQSTMGELWAILHFIMPVLFEGHDEYNEWFAKNIESHLENASLMDDGHLSRLHAILKPFVLRRSKQDVENELSDKVDIYLRCPLTSRQRFMYSVIKRKIRCEELQKPVSSSQNSTTNLTNLLMQLRKVCNHPDLIERREVKSPFHMKKVQHRYPKLIFRDGILAQSLSSKQHIFEKTLSIFNPINTHRSLFSDKNVKTAQSFRRRRFYQVEDVNVGNVDIGDANAVVYDVDSEWSFLRLAGVSSGDVWKIYCGGIFERLKLLVGSVQESKNIDRSGLKIVHSLTSLSTEKSSVFKDLFFVRPTDTFYSWGSVKITSGSDETKSEVNLVVAKPPIVLEMQPIRMPKFLSKTTSKVTSEGREPYFYDPSAVIWLSRLNNCSSMEELNLIMHGTIDLSKEISCGGLAAIQPSHGWSRIILPDREKLVTDSIKLVTLRNLLKKLKAEGHKVLIYSQMTKMIDLLEEFMLLCKWSYTRLDNSAKITEGSEIVEEFEERRDTFVSLVSTRSAGVGINLSSADTVIFYDWDGNSVAEQQAMDRAVKGQMKPMTVYRMICKGTVEERMLPKSKGKSDVIVVLKWLKKMGVSSGSLKAETLKSKEMLSFLSDDEESERKYRLKHNERKICGTEEREVGTSSQSVQYSPDSQESTNPSTNVQLHIEARGMIERKIKAELGVGTSLINSVPIEMTYGESVEGSLPGSPNLSDELEADLRELEFESAFDEIGNTSNSAFYDDYSRSIDWNGGSVSDYEEDLSFLPKKSKIGRGTGKRGRPPSRVRVQMREVDNGQLPPRRGPGRPRLRPIGPANQGIRGRRPGRPPLSKKAETISSSLTPLTPSQRVFGVYSSPSSDLNLS